MALTVARVSFDQKHRPFVEVHVKYAFEDATAQAYARMTGTGILHRASGSAGAYEGPRTLRDWMARAGAWETPEKVQIDEVVSANPEIIDLEMGLPASGDQKSALKVDLVALETGGQAVRVVFWEAKRASDRRLKLPSPRPEVMDQIDGYRAYFEKKADNCHMVAEAYRTTCIAMKRFCSMADPTSGELNLDPLILSVAENRCPLEIDPMPRLVIFGSQKGFTAPDWPEHEAKLVERVPVLKLRTDAYRLSASGPIG